MIVRHHYQVAQPHPPGCNKSSKIQNLILQRHCTTWCSIIHACPCTRPSCVDVTLSLGQILKVNGREKPPYYTRPLHTNQKNTCTHDIMETCTSTWRLLPDFPTCTYFFLSTYPIIVKHTDCWLRMMTLHVHNCMHRYEHIYRALQVIYQRLEAWLSCYVERHYGSASLNQVTTTPNLIKALHNLFRRPQLQTKSFLIPYFNWQVTCKALYTET